MLVGQGWEHVPCLSIHSGITIAQNKTLILSTQQRNTSFKTFFLHMYTINPHFTAKVDYLKQTHGAL